MSRRYSAGSPCEEYCDAAPQVYGTAAITPLLPFFNLYVDAATYSANVVGPPLHVFALIFAFAAGALMAMARAIVTPMASTVTTSARDDVIWARCR